MRSILDVPARRRTSTVAQAGLPARVAVTVARVVDPAVACEARGETATSGAVCASNRRPGSRHVRAVRSSRLPRSRRDRVRRPRGDRRRTDQPAPPLEDLTYARIGELARAQAAALDEHGHRPGRAGGDRLAQRARLLVSFFGVSGFGRVLVPINFRLSTDEIAYIVEHSGASAAARRSRARRRLADVHVRAHDSCSATRATTQLYRARRRPDAWDADEDATATINYTSGTTARPKGVQLTHRNLWLNATTFGWHLGVNDRDVYLHTLPMFHANGWGMPYAHHRDGRAGTSCCARSTARRSCAASSEHGVTLMCAAPAVVNAVLDGGRGLGRRPIPGRGRVRIVVAGAPPPTKTIERVETELGWEFMQIYGLTETSPLLTINRTRAEWDDLGPERRAAEARPGRRARARRAAARRRRQGEVLARSQRRARAATGTSPTRPRRRSSTAGSTPATAACIDDDGYLRSPTARRT